MSLKSSSFFIVLGAIINFLGLQTTAQITSDISLSNQPSITGNYQPAISGSYQPSPIAPPSLVFIPGVFPNAFTSAAWSIPEIQEHLLRPVTGYRAAETYFFAVNDDLIQIGHPSPATIANNVAQNLAGFDQFNIALYLHFKGQVLEKFLPSEGYEITPGLAQLFADTLQASVRSSQVNNYETLVRALLKGYVAYVSSLGFNFVDKAYVLSVLFNEEVLKYQKFLNP